MLRVFGSRISYFTGKVETYLRSRSIEYALCRTVGNEQELIAAVGLVQHPVVQLGDGRWMTDSTPMLAWLDAQHDAPSIYPTDPAMRFVALLIEDYADEWLWRSAMHYRWSYVQSRQYASGVLVDEQIPQMRLPRLVKRAMISRRQLIGFVRGDGVTRATWDHVEAGYLRVLDCLEAVFAERPFLLGDAPTNADFGLMGPMLRHFSMDPVPAEIMRTRAPGVYEWVARLWNHRAARDDARLIDVVDAPLAALLEEACETHLVQLAVNASALARDEGRYDQTIQGCTYQGVPSSRYRVWCLEELQREWAALDDAAQASLRPHLPEASAAVLWTDSVPKPSGYDPERNAPFGHALNVFGQGVPPR